MRYLLRLPQRLGLDKATVRDIYEAVGREAAAVSFFLQSGTIPSHHAPLLDLFLRRRRSDRRLSLVVASLWW